LSGEPQAVLSLWRIWDLRYLEAVGDGAGEPGARLEAGAGGVASPTTAMSAAGAEGTGPGRTTGLAFSDGDGEGEGEADGEGNGRAAGPEYCSASAITWFTYHHAWLYVKTACASPAEPGDPPPAAHSIRAAV